MSFPVYLASNIRTLPLMDGLPTDGCVLTQWMDTYRCAEADCLSDSYYVCCWFFELHASTGLR
jgi:hypothetical protein